MRSIVKIAETVKPPRETTAMGEVNSEPSVKPEASGKTPKTDVMFDITMGRNRDPAA